MLKAETLDDITRETVALACRYSVMIDPDNKIQQADMGVVDFITTEEGHWLARVFPATSQTNPIAVPGSGGIQPTMTEAMVVLNRWLTEAVAQVGRRGSA